MQGIIPDSSVPIKTGTVPDLGTPDVNANTGQVKPIVFPKPEYTPEDPLNRVYRPDEFGYSAAIWGGFVNNGMGAALLASDMPAFEVQQGYDAEAALLVQEKELGYQVGDVDREHLLRSRSEGEFQYRQFQIDEKAQGMRAMAARPFTGLVGASADVDVVLGYGIGAASRVAKLGRAATATNLTVGTVAGTTGTYAYAYGDAPFSNTDAAVHVAVASSLAFLYGTGFKYAKKGEEAATAKGSPEAPVGDAVPSQPLTPAPSSSAGATAPIEDAIGAVQPQAITQEQPPLIIKKGVNRGQAKQYAKQRKAAKKAANRRIVDDPVNASDDDILKTIDDSDDPEFKGVL